MALSNRDSIKLIRLINKYSFQKLWLQRECELDMRFYPAALADSTGLLVFKRSNIFINGRYQISKAYPLAYPDICVHSLGLMECTSILWSRNFSKWAIVQESSKTKHEVSIHSKLLSFVRQKDGGTKNSLHRSFGRQHNINRSTPTHPSHSNPKLINLQAPSLNDATRKRKAQGNNSQETIAQEKSTRGSWSGRRWGATHL